MYISSSFVAVPSAYRFWMSWTTAISFFSIRPLLSASRNIWTIAMSLSILATMLISWFIFFYLLMLRFPFRHCHYSNPFKSDKGNLRNFSKSLLLLIYLKNLMFLIVNIRNVFIPTCPTI